MTNAALHWIRLTLDADWQIAERRDDRWYVIGSADAVEPAVVGDPVLAQRPRLSLDDLLDGYDRDRHDHGDYPDARALRDAAPVGRETGAEATPTSLTPARALLARMQALVGDARVDLDKPLPDDPDDDEPSRSHVIAADPDGEHAIVAMRLTVETDPRPRLAVDLLRDRWRDRVTLSSPEKGRALLGCLAAMLIRLGWLSDPDDDATSGRPAIRPIRSGDDHAAALDEIDRLRGADPGTPEGDRLDVLIVLADAYEQRHDPLLGGAAEVARDLLSNGWPLERVIAELAINTTEIHRQKAAQRIHVTDSDGRRIPLFGTHLGGDAAATWLRAEVLAAISAAADRLPAERIGTEIIDIGMRHLGVERGPAGSGIPGVDYEIREGNGIEVAGTDNFCATVGDRTPTSSAPVSFEGPWLVAVQRSRAETTRRCGPRRTSAPRSSA